MIWIYHQTYGLSMGHTTISLITLLANSSPAISSHDTGGPWSIILRVQNVQKGSLTDTQCKLSSQVVSYDRVKQSGRQTWDILILKGDTEGTSIGSNMLR